MPKRSPKHGPTTVPQVGIWWWTAGKLIHFNEVAEEVPSVEGFRDSSFAHVEQWEQVIAKNPRLRRLAYDEVPRGRVLQANESFCLLMSHRESKNQKLRAEIISAFHLPAEGIRVIPDEHYTTSRPGTQASLGIFDGDDGE